MHLRMNAKEAVAQVFQPEGKTVVDVGCGDGAMVRHLARLGAKAFGVETGEAELKRAHAKQTGNEAYRAGRGEALPFDDAAFDAVLYLNSFHHVPSHAMQPALDEAARVLKPGGVLIVVEPLADGSYFEAMRPIEDETEIRAAAYAALRRPPPCLIAASELIYENLVRLRDADDFIQALTAVDAKRRERLPQVEAELRRLFAELSGLDEQGRFFIAPMRRNVLQKIGDR